MATIGFAGLCHKIPIMKRVLGEGTWKMFLFKVSALIVPFLGMDTIMPQAEEEEMDYLWKNMKERYRNYKYTGDILELNETINLVDH